MKKVKVKAKDCMGRNYTYYKYINEQNELSIGAIGNDRNRAERQRDAEENGTRETRKSGKVRNNVNL